MGVLTARPKPGRVVLGVVGDAVKTDCLGDSGNCIEEKQS